MKVRCALTDISRLAMLLVLGVWAGSESVAAQPNDNVPKLAEASAAAIASYTEAANLQNNRRYELAAMDWEKFLKNYPDTTLSPQADHYAGVCWLQLKEYAKAAPHFQAVVDKWKNVPKFALAEDGFLNLGWCQYQLGLLDNNGGANQFGDAASTFLNSLNEYPAGKYVDQVLYFLGDSLYLQSEALLNESQTLRADGKQAEADEKKEQSDKQKLAALSPLEQLVEKHPNSSMRASAMYALGVAYEETSQYPAAAGIYADFLKEFPDNALATEVRMRTAETVAQRGIAAKAGNDDRQAAEAFADAAKRFSEVASIEGFDQADHAAFRHADCLVELEKFGEAAKMYARLASDFPESSYVSDAVLNAGRYFFRDNQYDKAKPWLERAAAGNTAHLPEAAHWLCRIHLRDKHPEKASEIATRVLPSAAGSDFLVDLKLDHADALYENPSQRAESLPLFQAIATEHPKHRLAPQALYNAAFTALDLKRYDVGQKLAETFLDQFARDTLVPDVKYIAAECKLLKNDHAAAEAAYRDLIENHASHGSLPIWQIRLAWALFLQNKHADVVSFLAPIIDQFKTPDQTAESQHLLGASQFSLKKYGEADAALAAALAADPKWRKADATYLLRSQALFQLDQTDEGIQLVKRLINEFPDSDRLAEANYRLGEFAYKLKDYKTSVESYGKVLETWSESEFVPYSFWGKGWSELKHKQFADAVASFTGLINNHPQHELVPDARFARGMCRRQTGDHQGAIEDIDQAIAGGLSDNYATDAQYEKGQAQVALKDLKGAAASFAAALKADAKSPIADKCLYELAWALKSSDQPRQALDNFGKLAEEYPRSLFAAEANFHVGEDLYQKKQYVEAAQRFSDAARDAKSDSLSEKSLYKLGWANYELKIYDQSLKNFQSQVKKHPAGSLKMDGLIMVAENLFHLKNYEEALPAYAAARAAADANEKATDEMKALVLLHGGQSAIELSKWDDALQMLRPVVADYANTSFVTQAQFEIGAALMGQRKFDEAVKAFEEARTQATLQGDQGLKARSLYMKGEAYFAQKDYQNAIKTFDYTTGIFNSNSLSDEVKKWLGYATFEAGQCHYVLIADAKAGSPQRADLIKNAKKYFDEVVTNYPNHAVAKQAQKQLALLAKLK